MTLSVFRRNVFDTEADSSHLIFSKTDCLDLVTKCKHVFYMVDALFADLGNMNHSLFARSELEVAEVDGDGGRLQPGPVKQPARRGRELSVCLVR